MQGRAPTAASEPSRLLALAADLAACEEAADLEAPLRSLQLLLGADAIGSGELRPQPDAAMDVLPEVTFPDLFDAESLSCWAAHWNEHPYVQRQLAGPEPRPLRLGDFVSERGLRRLGIYAAYRRLGLRGEIALQLHWEPDRVACVTAHRSGGRFGERERALLAQLRPHLRAARSRIEAGRRARRHRELLEAGLRRGGVTTALVDRGGRVLAAGDGGAALLGRWFGPPRRPDRVPAELLAWLQRQSRRADPAPLRRAAADRALEVTAAATEEGWLLLLRERRLGPPDAAALAATLPITERQAEVLALVSRGLADAAIANQLGISVRTVGHHVRHILGRLEVPSRTAAAAVALGAD